MILKAMRKELGDKFWLDRDNLGPIPNGDGTFRQGPKMLTVYDNAHSLFMMVLVIDAINITGWMIVITWICFEYGTDKKDFLMAAIVNLGGLGAISAFCAALTVFAVRAERLMVVIANAEVDRQPIMGMHDDWPVFEQEAEIVDDGSIEIGD